MGQLNEAQREALKPFVADKVVHDFGAGNCLLAHVLLELGAKRVICIDRHTMPPPETERVETWEGHYEDFREHAKSVDVALMSWPVNWTCCLEPFVWGARVVIYLGKCTDGSMCGYDGLWRALTAQEVLAHVPDRMNTLIVYGPDSRPDSRLYPEEHAGVHTERMWGYEEIMLAMRSTRYDRIIGEPYSEKPNGATPLPEMHSWWAHEDGIWIGRVTRIDEGLVTLKAATDWNCRSVHWWDANERSEWSPV